MIINERKKEKEGGEDPPPATSRSVTTVANCDLRLHSEPQLDHHAPRRPPMFRRGSLWVAVVSPCASRGLEPVSGVLRLCRPDLFP